MTDADGVPVHLTERVTDADGVPVHLTERTSPGTAPDHLTASGTGT